MRKTISSGSICIIPEETHPDLPLKYYLHYGMELIHLALSRIGDQLQFNTEVNSLVAIIEKEKANKYQAKTNKTRELRRRIYRIMHNLEKIYRLDNLRKPSFQEQGENLASKGIFGYRGKPYKERALREIKKLGDEGRL